MKWLKVKRGSLILMLSALIILCGVWKIHAIASSNELEPDLPTKRDIDWNYWSNPPHIFNNLSGNVGIGINDPQYMLHVEGQVISGENSDASGQYATVSGGQNNTANGDSATVGGGYYNNAQANYATISGGGPSNTGDPTYTNNRVYDDYGTIGGGGNNQAGYNDGYPTRQEYATVSGGYNNDARNAYTTVGGGESNTASASWATVGGGDSNTARGSYATVGGGNENTVSGYCGTVAGGLRNKAFGYGATVPGGENNNAEGLCSFAAGRRAKALHDGTFVWATDNYADFTSTAVDQFLIRAGGGVGINTTSPENALHVNGAINLDPMTEPSTPATGFVLYVDSADGDLKAKASTGTVTVLAYD